MPRRKAPCRPALPPARCSVSTSAPSPPKMALTCWPPAPPMTSFWSSPPRRSKPTPKAMGLRPAPSPAPPTRSRRISPPSPPGPLFGPGYSNSKVALEQALAGRATILRPTAFHGIGSRHPRDWWVVKRLFDGRLIPLTAPRAGFHTTSTASIVSLTTFCLGHRLPDVHPLRTRPLRPRRRRRRPAPLTRSLAFLFDKYPAGGPGDAKSPGGFHQSRSVGEGASQKSSF